MKLHLKALRYGSHRIAPANYTIPIESVYRVEKLCNNMLKQLR